MTQDRTRAARNGLRAELVHVFSEMAERPGDEHPIPVGRALAEAVGYPKDLLDSLPSDSVDAFAGVTYIWGFAEIPLQGTILDLGCGAGLDLLIAARRAERVIGIDFSKSMLARARKAADLSAAGNVEAVLGDAERIPLEDASVDSALVNGIFNLNPARAVIFGELARVIRAGGRAFVAELILTDGAVPSTQQSDWFS